MVAHNYALRYLSRSQDRLSNTLQRNRLAGDKRASAGRMIDMLRGTGANVDAFSGAQTPEEVNYLIKMKQVAQERERAATVREKKSYDRAFNAGVTYGDESLMDEHTAQYGGTPSKAFTQGTEAAFKRSQQEALATGDKATLEATKRAPMSKRAREALNLEEINPATGSPYTVMEGDVIRERMVEEKKLKKIKAGAIKQGIDPKTGKPAFYARDSNGKLKKLKGALPPKKKEASRVSNALRLYKAMFDDGYGGMSPDAPKFEKWIKSEDYATILRSIRQGPASGVQKTPTPALDELPAGAIPAGTRDGKEVYRLPNGDLFMRE